jgi:hypothetical protein
MRAHRPVQPAPDMLSLLLSWLHLRSEMSASRSARRYSFSPCHVTPRRARHIAGPGSCTGGWRPRLPRAGFAAGYLRITWRCQHGHGEAEGKRRQTVLQDDHGPVLFARLEAGRQVRSITANRSIRHRLPRMPYWFERPILRFRILPRRVGQGGRWRYCGHGGFLAKRTVGCAYPGSIGCIHRCHQA